MQEILAKNLQPLFDNTSLTGKKTYSGELYEIWDVSGEDFKSMCDMSDEEFEKLCPEGMWRSADGSNMGFTNAKAIVNEKHIICWDKDYYLPDEYEDELCNEFESLLEYFCDCLGASQPKNICALAVDLARYNNMTMGELFTKYEG